MRNCFVLLALLAMPALAQDGPGIAADEPTAAPAPASEAPDTPAGATGGDATSAAAVVAANEPAALPSPDGVKTMSGMSILGNEEAPKSLVIVPWKSSRLGDGLGVTNALDERPRPLDREVFMRELHYFSLRSGGEE